jgi:hypothetical protein
MSALGPRDLIVTEKDDGMMLANLYRYMKEDAFTGRVMAALAPYKNTHILFNPYYPRNYTRGVFLATLDEAAARHMLDGADRIFFMRMAWSRSPLNDLMLCGALEKQIITFPAFGAPLSRNDIDRARAAIMVISRDVMFRDILAPAGKARACLDGKHDIVPEYTVHVP